MRAKLLLTLLAVPVVCAAAPRAADAQRDGNVYAYRDRYRDRIYIPRHEYKDRADRADRGGRIRAEARRRLEVYGVRDRYRDTYRYRDNRRYRDESRYRNDRRYRDDYRYRNNDRYRDDDRYRDEYRYRDRYEYRRRRTNVLDLVLLAAGARYVDRHVHSRNCGHRGLTIRL